MSALNNLDVLGVVAVAAAVLTPVSGAIFYVVSDRPSRAKISRWLKSEGVWPSYCTLINSFLSRLDRVVGTTPNLSSARFFYSFAVMYSLGAIVIGWVLGGPNELGGLLVFPMYSSIWHRLAAALLFGVMFFLGRRLAYTVENANSGVVRKYGHMMFYTIMIFMISESIGVAKVTTVTLFAAGYASTTKGMLTILAFPIILFCGYKVFSHTLESEQYYVSLSVFIFCIPLANSALDQLSWSITRQLISEAVAAKKIVELLKNILLDIVMAILLTLAVMLLIPSLIATINTEIFGHNPVAVRPLIDAARNEPFGAGLAATLMWFTTLVPTLFHLIAGTVAIIVWPTPGRYWVINTLSKDSPDALERAGITAWMVLAVGLATLLSVSFCIGLWMGIEAMIDLPLSEVLHKTAVWCLEVVHK